ncbi:MAG TPA: hypothetical protein VNH44_11025, partial [Micropepsaceae bacterium]|nr:hypothetical protein [Micropepsaceae bacterium]
PAWGYLETDIATLDDEAFLNRDGASTSRAALTKQFNAIFEKVSSGKYDEAVAMLPPLSADIDRVLAAKQAAALKLQIADATRMAERGMLWKTRASAPH